VGDASVLRLEALSLAPFPILERRGLGVGLDLRWGDPAGFVVGPAGEDRVAPALEAFLAAEGPGFSHAFFSWQARDRARLRLEDYAPAWDALVAALPRGVPLALHHTALDLAALEPAPRGALLDFTNALCARAGVRWINEDVGFWSWRGRPVAYPLPPVLDGRGLTACARNVRECQRALDVPLVLEFPGFDATVAGAVAGTWDAYDFFRRLAEETGAPVNLDVAHLLSWRWRLGHRGEALTGGLERLPLAHAFEIHLSGCEIVPGPGGDVFHDAHDGRLLDEQLALLGRLLSACPNLRAVTFEDPRLDAAGALDVASRASLERLRAAVASWIGPAPARAELPAPTPAPANDVTLRHDDDGVARLDAHVAATRASLVRERAFRGTGRLVDGFSGCVAGWRAAHPEDATLDGLFGRFVASSHAEAWREQPGLVGGSCLESCFAAFARDERLAPPLVVEEELLSVLLRALTVVPEPAFAPPPLARRVRDGWVAVSSATPPILHAALRGRTLRGELTPAVERAVAALPPAD
jgi:uncharacterized protein (UPF0276 family)